MAKWPCSGFWWTQLPFRDSQIICRRSQSRVIPGIVIKSADSGLWILVDFFFFNNWYLFPHLSLLAFLLVSRFPQNYWQPFHSHHEMLSSVSWDEYVWPMNLAIIQYSKLLSCNLLFCRGHRFLLNDVDSTFHSLNIIPLALREMTDRDRKQMKPPSSLCHLGHYITLPRSQNARCPR